MKRAFRFAYNLVLVIGVLCLVILVCCAPILIEERYGVPAVPIAFGTMALGVCCFLAWQLSAPKKP